ncbi:MAG: Methyltransferase small [Hyphomicrobiales bacterium]|nr:Methyltransferase small [Hyphomicrobiales bacterium]
MRSEPPEAGTRVDHVLGGRLALRQLEKGHRAGTDAMLLAASVPRDARGLLIDAGCGVGTAGLAAGIDRPHLDLVLFDREPDSVRLATENLIRNGLDTRGRALEADLVNAKSRRASGILEGSAAFVISNPPFLEAGKVRRSPDEARARAHVLEGENGLELWVRACAALVAPHGELLLIHRADQLRGLLDALEGRVGGIAVCPVHPRPGEDAIRVLLRGRKGSRAPLRLRPPLVLHESDGAYTPLADALNRGEAEIVWT